MRNRIIAKNLTYRKKSTHKRISTDVRLSPSPAPQDYNLSTATSNSSAMKIKLPIHNPRPRLHPKRKAISSYTPDLRPDFRFTPDLYSSRLDYFPSNLTSIENTPRLKTPTSNFKLEFT